MFILYVYYSDPPPFNPLPLVSRPHCYTVFHTLMHMCLYISLHVQVQLPCTCSESILTLYTVEKAVHVHVSVSALEWNTTYA